MGLINEDLLIDNNINEEGDYLSVDQYEVINEVVNELISVSENEVISENENLGDKSDIFIYGGDDIVNYYNTYFSVSGNEVVSENITVSDNIINKPLNEYNTQEGLIAYSIFIALGIGIYLIIRRAVFKWK